MGAEFCEKTYPDMSFEELQQKFKEDREEMGYESGYMYSGDWASSDEELALPPAGIVTFSSFDEARKKVMDGHKNHDPIIAVQYIDSDEKSLTELSSKPNDNQELAVSDNPVVTLRWFVGGWCPS